MHSPEDTADFWFHVYKPYPGDTIVDVGAGRGEDLVTFSRTVGPTGLVLAIEAHPLNLAILTKIVEREWLGNVSIIGSAATSRPGVAYAQDGGNYLENCVEMSPFEGSLEVPGQTLDEICKQNGIGEIALLKMNIEGGELDAIQGATVCLSKVKYAVIACHDFRADNGESERFRTKAAIEAKLTEAGFEVIHRDHAYSWGRDHLHAKNLRFVE